MGKFFFIAVTFYRHVAFVWSLLDACACITEEGEEEIVVVVLVVKGRGGYTHIE